MSNLVTILDCDFGDGSIEREVLEGNGLRLKMAPQRSASTMADSVDHESVAVISQYHPITEQFITSNPQLRAVVRYGVGLDVIDLEACARAGVVVSGVDDYCTEEVADHALALMLTILRSIGLDRLIKNGQWPTADSFPEIPRLSTLSLGLLGLGRIASAVAVRARAFGITTFAHDPYLRDDDIVARGAIPADFKTAIGSDIVSLHLPLSSETAGILNSDSFSSLKWGAILINVSRGGLIDEHALLAALDSGRVAAAGLDVFSEEGPGNELARHRRVVATPHIGYLSRQASLDLRTLTAQTVVSLLGEVTHV